MSKTDKEMNVSRRGIISLSITMLASFLAAVYYAIAGSSGKKSQYPTNINKKIINNSTKVEKKKKMAENILDYGARPNPTDPDLAAAQENIKAIWEAAEVAGEDGWIYIPEGTYYVGQQQQLRNIDIGGAQPKGISWIGDGPFKSTIAMTEHMNKNDQSHVLMYYDAAEHRNIKFQDLHFYGNAKMLDRLKSGVARAQNCIRVVPNAAGKIICSNILFNGWHDQAIQSKDVDWDINYCSFIEVGAESRKKGISGHCIAVSNGDLKITDTILRRIGSFALNYRFGDGNIMMKNCHVRSYGTGLLKLSAGSQMEFRNTYVEGNTSWTENNYPDRDGIDFKGRFFVDQLVDRNDTRKEVIFTDCELRDCLEDGIKCKHRMKLDMDNTAMYNNNIDNQRPGAIVARDGGDLQCDMSGQAISVHNTNGHALDITSDSTGSGTIETLYHNTTDGLGNLDQIQINNDLEYGSPLSVNVADIKDIGIVPLEGPSS